MESSTVADFPSWVLQPRTETGARQFLNKYPEFDGRKTVIAILDSGIDPGAGGLQVTSDGRPKVIERIDASGCGDVNMSKEVEPKDGIIEGLTSRKLKVPGGLKNPSGKFRIGVKRAISLYPRSLRDRIVKERLEKEWDPVHKLNVAKVAKKIQEFEAKNGGASGCKELTGLEKLAKDDLDIQMEMLSSADKKFRSDSVSLGDVLPIYDVVSYFDGELWNVIIDTSEQGDLEAGIHLRPYSQTHDFAPLCESSKLNISINIYDEGNVVQIVSMCSSHGTHVASIAAACFPDAPEKNGLAPGAQIISITIGDNRLGSMETGTALVRACTYIIQRQKNPELSNIDVINMSYGEHSHWSTTGRIGELMHEVIDNYGVVWVASAGNDGPALCTIGTPPDINTNSVIGVGAYVSPEMMLALYSAREKLPGTPYTWTSRGPTIDGDRGVTICAPGGAITSVPQFTLRCTQLMNGTSMASPHTCGAVSLLLSGMKQENLRFSPFSVKRALAVTAKPLPHSCHYGQGHGLLQIEGAFEHMKTYSDSIDRDVRFAVTCSYGINGAKGIHMRGANMDQPAEVPVKVEPVFLNCENAPGDCKIDFHMELALTCPDSWVRYPDHLDMMYVSRHFSVYVDPSGLEPGVHSTYIKAYDVRQPGKGMLFEIPVTVVKREPIDITAPRPVATYQQVFQPGTLRRHFYVVPDKCTYAVVKVVSNEKVQQGKFVLHTVQLLPKKVVRTMENHKMFTLHENGEYSYSFAVKEGVVLEVCLAKWWANIGNISTSYSVSFLGVQPEPKDVILHGAETVTRIDLASRSQTEVQPEIKLKNCVQNYRPSEAKVVPLGERDVIPINRTIYELQLTYNFSVSKATEVTPNFPLLSDVLYESEFESQLWMLFNSHKQLVCSGDAYPNKWAAKVEKDDYVIRAHVRSERREILEKMLDLPMMLSVKMSSPITLDCYTSFANASTTGKKASSFTIPAGSTVPFYITTPPCNDKQTKNAMLGQYLQGTMTILKDELGKKTDGFTIKYFLNEPSKREKSNSKKSNNGKSTEASYKESLIEHKISWLSKLDPSSAESLELLEELTSESSKADPIQVRMARLQSLELDKKPGLDNVTQARAEEALELTNYVLGEVNENELLAFVAIKQDNRPDAADIKKEMEKKKNFYIEALQRRGLALCALDRIEEATEVLFKALKLVDANDPKMAPFVAAHAEKLGHLGRALKVVQQLLESKPNSPDLEQRISHLYEELDWVHCVHFFKRGFPAKFPVDYEPF